MHRRDVVHVRLILYLAGFMCYTVITDAFLHFQDRIPNGGRIPHPCKPNYMWYGVGHENSKGSGPRNVFGERFKYWGYVWNNCLCEEDSDGDGLTNGEELGDPDCVWTVGQVPPRTSSLSHPGVCTPYDSEFCASMNGWVDCSTEPDFDCPAINEQGVDEILIQMPETAVPDTSDTTYMCAAFNLTEVLPAGDSHLIAVRGHIDNAHVMHHILAYACTDDNGPTALNDYSTPRECDMVNSLCSIFIGTWTVGIDGICYHNNSGVALGTNGYKYVVFEYHWNNPEFRSDYTDASGLTLYVSENIRQYDSGVLFAGPVFIQIPPRWEMYNITGGCSSTCMSDFLGSESMWVTHVAPHMHYKGEAMLVHISRAGQEDIIINFSPYYYDDPDIIVYDDPLEIRPGDEITVTCSYNSKNTEEYTYFGEATADEMCFAVFLYYPFASSEIFCQTTNGYGRCAGNDIHPFGEENCDLDTVESVLTQYTFQLYFNCLTNGLTECTTECREIIQNINDAQSCLSGSGRDLVMYGVHDRLGAGTATRLASCEPIAPLIVGDSGYTVDSEECVSGGTHFMISMHCMVIAFATFLFIF